MKPKFDHDPQMSILATKFAEARRVRRYARIPDALRQEVITALDSGTDLALVLKSLSLTGPQIALWRDRLLKRKPPARAPEPPRILNVTPSEPVAFATTPSLRVSCEAGRVLLEFSF